MVFYINSDFHDSSLNPDPKKSMIPDNITKEHIEKAIAEIDKKGVRKGRLSSTYDLVHNGKSYPPKLVISIANRFANEEELAQTGQKSNLFMAFEALVNGLEM